MSAAFRNIVLGRKNVNSEVKNTYYTHIQIITVPCDSSIFSLAFCSIVQEAAKYVSEGQVQGYDNDILMLEYR